MKFVKEVKIELSEEEKKAIYKVIGLIDEILNNYDSDDLWELCGSEEECWVGIQCTLRYLLAGGIQ